MRHKIGILQGRLSDAPKGRLQYFPKKWSEEFNKANKAGFSYIEFFSERKLNLKNPIWDKKKLILLKTKYLKENLKFYSFIDDYILKASLDNNLLKYFSKLIHNLSYLNIKIFIIPLYGKNKINKKNIKKISVFLDKISSECKKKKIKLLIESNISPNLYFELQKILKNKVGFTFDTGNRILLKRNIYKDLDNFGNNISHVHIKDKNIQKKNVSLGSGLVNFKKIFKKLSEIKYDGNFTLETNRYDRPVYFAKKNLNFIKNNLV